ncbi:MAG: N-acetylmuramoyl-L-alanine amidase [Trueperaceae bacterium]
MRRSLALVVLLLMAGATAAPTLSVNGREVPGLTLSLVEGVSYAPAGAYAEALGARSMIDYGSGLVSLELGGRMLVLRTFTEPEDAATEGMTVNVNGVERPGTGAVFDDGQLFLPVSLVARSFLGYTTYVPERERVMVVLPRGQVRDLDWTRQSGADRLIVSLSSNVSYALYYNEPVNSLEVRFDRSDAAQLAAVEDGRYFSRAVALGERGGAVVRVSLEPEVGYTVYTVPEGRGYRLVVDIFPEAAEEEPAAQAPRVVIDAAHGGEDGGMIVDGSPESGMTLDFSRRLAEQLDRRGLRTELTRSEDHDVALSSRSGMGVGADLFLSIHVHPDADGAIGVYYLAEADGAANLDLAVRRNAEADLPGTTDALRRRLLLNLVPDVEVGRRYALGLESEVFARSGVRVEDAQSAPLAVLAGAAGRGLLLELPAEEVGEAVVEAVADAVAALLQGREVSP